MLTALKKKREKVEYLLVLDNPDFSSFIFFKHHRSVFTENKVNLFERYESDFLKITSATKTYMHLNLYFLI